MTRRLRNVLQLKNSAA